MTLTPGFARREFALAPHWTFLNHGSFGAVPRSIRAEQQRWRDRLEAQPVAFLQREWPTLIDAARAPVAAFIGARPSNTVFVHNATTGVQAVVGSWPLEPGDELLTTRHRYDAVHRILSHRAHTTGARVIEVDPGVAPSQDDVLDAILSAVTPRTRLAVVDAVSSSAALVFPVERLVPALQERGVAVLVDAAHAPGQLDLDVSSLGADAWVGNLHKWVCAPRGAAVLVVRPDHHHRVHAAVPSHGHGCGLHAAFDWPGTFDPTAWLTAPAACALHDAWGGPALRAAHVRLIRAWRPRLARSLGVDLPATWPDTWGGSMAAVPLPDVDTSLAPALQVALAAHHIEAPIATSAHGLWVRVSAHAAHNQPGDIEPLLSVLPGLVQRARDGQLSLQ